MGMALKCDVSEACKVSGTAKPVDLVHLSRQTMGDEELERDVLSIFMKQSASYLRQILDAGNERDRQQCAHQLKGAARGIGAWELARIAEAAEQPGFSDMTAIQEEILAVCEYIKDLSR